MITQYEPLIDYKDLNKRVSKYLKQGDGWLTEYQNTQEFENSIAKFLGVNHAIVVNNGTIAISLALIAEGIRKGDRVLVPDISMIATAYAVELIGAEPIFCDIDPQTMCLDLNVARGIIEYADLEIKAVINVSLNGRNNHWLAYNDFQTFCSINKVKLIEDNAQSFGSKHSTEYISCPERGIGSFSFSMPKIITTGQGGCLVTNEQHLADNIRRLKDFGRVSGGIDEHEYFGINSKFTELQAITGLSQLKNINFRIERKKHIYNRYKEQLISTKGIHFLNTSDEVTPWFVDIYVHDRDELMDYLKKLGVSTRAMYPCLHGQRQYRPDYIGKGHVDFIQSSRMSNMGLWLPSSMNLADYDIDRICSLIRDFFLNKALDKT